MMRTERSAKMIDKLVDICYAMAGVVVIFGLMGIYIHMNNDGEKTEKYIKIIFGVVIALIMLAQSLPELFTN